jgi:hypothetical protein
VASTSTASPGHKEVQESAWVFDVGKLMVGVIFDVTRLVAALVSAVSAEVQAVVTPRLVAMVLAPTATASASVT